MMKKLIVLIVILFAFVACEDDENLDRNTATSEDLTLSMTSADGLRISEFREDGRDKTSSYSIFLFLFREDGTVTAEEGGQSINGTYSVFRDDGRLELEMAFPSSSGILNELTDDWYFISQSDNLIRFEDSGDVIEFRIQ